MTLIIYKNKADLYQLDQDSVQSDGEKYTKLVTGFRINLQPAGLEFVTTQPDGAIGKLFRAFTSQTGIRQGMIVVTSGTSTVSGMRYEVTGIEEYNGPAGRHFELLMKSAHN